MTGRSASDTSRGLDPTGPRGTVTAAVIANAAAAAAVASPGVVALHHGAVGELATYADGQRIPGVAVDPGPPPRVLVQLVAAYGPSLHATADGVRRAVAEALAGLDPSLRATPVQVSIADIADVRSGVPR